ncbi:TRAP transporter substrate-binding protein DctP [Methylomarinum sp. Ch1-1]|uniref:TRAP transporter substrate-binding protein DctP n=1 Tax=Methylomarinum roseum TaxID=3067653 RepID=A0AAU7NU98_9GAMM|nr:TRAP transporter substrate-binding protein DctP [Methylomarinum sp. Ch1-1]MDP4519758.1 TRAP transporter substrate-binding protein DctP [Methylomarinum sp. Ch1-1]
MKIQVYQAMLWLLLTFAANTAQAYTFKIATLSPDGSYWVRQLRAGAEEINRKTDGRVKFKFYPGGVMGDDVGVLRKMRLRQLHGAAVTNAVLSNIYPDIQLYNLVLKFHNLQEVDYVRRKMDAKLMQGLEEHGVVPLGFAEVGMAYVMSTAPVQTLEQMRNYKVWVPDDNRVVLEAMKAFSISPIPLPLRDVLMGLQTGMIDVVAGSPVGALALQWHTKVKYVTDIPLLYAFGALVLDKGAFARISAADRQIVRSVMGRVIEEIDKHTREDNLQAAEVLKEQGIQFLKPTPAAADELRRTIVSANRKIEQEGNMSADKIRELNAYLAEFRRQQ